MRVAHVAIRVSDWRRSLRFYHDVLGFRYVGEEDVPDPSLAALTGSDGVPHIVYLERDEVRIALVSVAREGASAPAPAASPDRPGPIHLSLRVRDLASLLEDLEEEGVRVLHETRSQLPEIPLGRVFVADPDGIPVELVERPGD